MLYYPIIFTFSIQYTVINFTLSASKKPINFTFPLIKAKSDQLYKQTKPTDDAYSDSICIMTL